MEDAGERLRGHDVGELSGEAVHLRDYALTKFRGEVAVVKRFRTNVRRVVRQVSRTGRSLLRLVSGTTGTTRTRKRKRKRKRTMMAAMEVMAVEVITME